MIIGNTQSVSISFLFLFSFHLHVHTCTYMYVPRLEKHFCVSFVHIRFVIGELLSEVGELLSEVGGRVGHGLVLAWFESYVLRLAFLNSSLQ